MNGFQHFGDVAVAYSRGRPGVPADACDYLTRHIPDAPDVLEIGAGTGALTTRLVDRSRTLVCLEPEQRLRRILHDTLRSANGAEVRAERFEEYTTHRSFDLVVASGAWHWVDPNLGIGAAARLLRDDGVLALVWNYTDLIGPHKELVHSYAFSDAFSRFKGTRQRVRNVADRSRLQIVRSRTFRLAGSRLSNHVELNDPATYEDLVRSFGCAKNYSAEEMDELAMRLRSVFTATGTLSLPIATTTRVDVFRKP